MIQVLLLVLILSLLVVLLFLVLKSKRFKTEDIQTAVSSSWINMGLGEKIGAIESHAKEIKDSYKSFEQMLRVPMERGSVGELSLEIILSDQLSTDLYGIRERILDGKHPDAYIESTVGIICIDSKFPLDNYAKMLESSDSKEKNIYRKNFLRDVDGHLIKIAQDYVCPDKGSAEFAFAYIPSEGVYYYLVTNALDLLRKYAKHGVQVVSPLTLSQKIELIKAGIQAKKLSQETERVKNSLFRLSQNFQQVDEKWQVIVQTHLRRLQINAEELDKLYKNIREEFNKIFNFTEQKQSL